MDIVTESALRILLPRRNLRGAGRQPTRTLIHVSIDRLRRMRKPEGALS